MFTNKSMLLLISFLIKTSDCIYQYYASDSRYTLMKIQGNFLTANAADVIKNYHFLHLADCIFKCKKLGLESCKSLNYRQRNNDLSNVNCTLLKINRKPDENVKTDQSKGVIVFEKNVITRNEIEEVTRLCGLCEYKNIVSGKVNFICDCRKVQEKPLKSCKETLTVLLARAFSIVTLSLKEDESFDAYCEYRLDGQVWMAVMHRSNGEVLNSPTMTNYEQGFGGLDQMYWLGLKHMNLLSMNNKLKMKVEYLTGGWQQLSHTYDGFTVDDKKHSYGIFYQNITNEGNVETCTELQCHVGSTCLKRTDICDDFLGARKCSDDTEMNYCGRLKVSFLNGHGDGSGEHVGVFDHQGCIQTCLAKRRAGDATITGATRVSNGDCYCISGMTIITEQTRYRGCDANGGCSLDYRLANFKKKYVTVPWHVSSDSGCSSTCHIGGWFMPGALKSLIYDTLNSVCHCFTEDGAIYYEETVLLTQISFTCGPGTIYCDDKCLDNKKICDGIEDCSNNIDERFCNKQTRDNLKCNYQKPFVDCGPDLGFWWGTCHDRYGIPNVPTRPDGLVNWVIPNLYYIKISLTETSTDLQTIRTCADVYQYMRCQDDKDDVTFKMDDNSQQKLKCFFNSVKNPHKKVIYTSLMSRGFTPDAVHRNFIFVGGNIPGFQWVGIKYFYWFFGNKPRNIQFHRIDQYDGQSVVVFRNFTTLGAVGRQIAYEEAEILPGFELMDAKIAQKKLFGFCNDSNLPYYWWGCAAKQPLFEKPADSGGYFYVADVLSNYFGITIMEDVP